MRFRLVPRDEGFYLLFNEAAENLAEAARLLRDLLDDPANAEVTVAAINACERRGDELTRTVLRRLNASFVTPFDREDIHALTEEIDDVVDDMFAAASLIELVGVKEPLPEVPELADILVTMTDELVELMRCLQRKEGARYHLERIEHLERHGDVLSRRCMATLFGGAYDALEVLKWKDIVQALEDSLNAIEDVSDVVESILVKNS